MTLSFLFKCHPLVINCKVNEKKVDFHYAIHEIYSLTLPNSFDYLCTLNGRPNDAMNLEVCSSNESDSLFSFYIVNKNDLLYSNLKKSNDLNKLTSDLSSKLFGGEKSVQPVLLIGSYDGCIYWKSFDKLETTELNEKILLNASSPIVYISSFKFVHNLSRNFDAVFNDNKASKIKQNNDDNCLFALTKSGRLHLYAFDKEYFYKVLILPHYIKRCIKFKARTQSKDIIYYLVYSTVSNSIYSINLECCFKDAVLQPKLLKNECNPRSFLIDEKEDLFVQLSSGRNTRLYLEEPALNSLQEMKLDTKSDTVLVKNCIDKLCILSNKIVQAQLKIDKLNLTLKQLNILQTIRMNINSIKEKNIFEIEKKFNCSQIEIIVTNKNAQLDDNFNGSHLILTSIQMNKALFHANAFYWANKCEHFNALKPNTKHITNFDIEPLVKDNIFPVQVNVHLIFDTRNYLDFTPDSTDQLYSSLNEQLLFESEKRQENILSEFSVCIYQSQFDLGDFFNINELDMLNNRKCFEINEFSLQYSMLMTCNQKLNLIKNLENLWTKLCFRCADWKGFFGENEKSDTSMKKKSHLFSNISLLLERGQKDEEGSFYKLDLLSNNNLNVESFYQNLLNFIYLKNRFLMMEKTGTQLCDEKISKLKKLNSKLNYLKEKQRGVNVSLVENSIEMDGVEETTNLFNNSSFPNLAEFYSIETFLILFEIYLELRSI